MKPESFSVPEGISKIFSEGISLELFQKMCLCRSFELNVQKAIQEKKIPRVFTYLSLGQEAATAALSLAFPNAFQFGQHRCHDLYLCYGGSPEQLRDELLGLPSGCARGMGGSASIHSPGSGMFGHDGLMGTQIPIAVGYALGSGENTLAIMGDASAEEGYVLGALGEAASKKAPILFVCMDNNLSILTEVKVRRNWTMVDEARAKDMPAYDLVNDPWLVMHRVNQVKNNLPAFLNIRYCRELWHEGPGCDGPPEWNRFEMVKNELISLGLGMEVESIERIEANFCNNLWGKVFEKEKQ